MQVPGDRKRCWAVCRKTIGCVHVKLSTEMRARRILKKVDDANIRIVMYWERKSEEKCLDDVEVQM